MCAIVVMQAGSTLSYEAFFNATHNNEDGYGVILKDRGKLEVRKDCPEKGNDPEVIYRILKDNEDIERIVHLRNATEGKVCIENTQPFSIYNSNKLELWLAHNGTFHGYKGATNFSLHDWVNEEEFGTELEGASDTRKFVELKMQPLMLTLKGAKGNADISDPLVQDIIKKYWESPVSNKGIIVANKLDHLYLGEWATRKEGDTVFRVSNTTYFDSLQRGRLYEQRQEERRKAHEAEMARRRAENPNPVVVREQQPKSAHEVFHITNEVFDRKLTIPTGNWRHIIEDWKMYERDGWKLLGNVTMNEWETAAGELWKVGDTKFLLYQMAQHIQTLTTERDLFESKLIQHGFSMTTDDDGNRSVEVH